MNSEDSSTAPPSTATPSNPSEKELYRQHHQTDLFEVLEVTRDSTQEEIRDKYNELLLLYHPDKGGDEKKFRDVKIAYRILSDPHNRAVYLKSLSSTFGDLAHEYRDFETGKHKHLGYEVSLDDFTKVEESEQEAKKAIFMQTFEQARPADEHDLIQHLKETARAPRTLEEIMLERQKHDQEMDDDVVLLEGLDPKKLNLDLFNQIFEKQRKETQSQSSSKGLASYQTLWSSGNSLCPIEQTNQGLCNLDLNEEKKPINVSLFSDPTYRYDPNQYLHGTYKTPRTVNLADYDPQLNVTQTRHNNPDDLIAQLQQRIKEQEEDRKTLLFLEKEDYVIASDHDPKNHPLSHLNMLGAELAGQLDPIKKKRTKAKFEDQKTPNETDSN